MLAFDEKDVAEDGSRCPAKWDGWMCWDSAAPATVNYEKCPDMTYSTLSYTPTECMKEYASKECLPNGTWYSIWVDDGKRTVQMEHTNYIQCSTPGATRRLFEVHMEVVVYSVSLLFTIIGSIIFIFYKQYKILRIQIHINFFVSLILTSFFAILLDLLIRVPHYNLNTVIDDK